MTRQKVTLSYGNLPETFGEIEIRQWSLQERNRRALKAWGIAWGAAVCCVVIPIAHFILVPSCLIAGPILAFVFRNQKSVVLGGIGICPKCGEKLIIVRGTEKWPLEDTCGKCFFTVKIRKI